MRRIVPRTAVGAGIGLLALFVIAGNLWATQPNLPALKLKGNVKRGKNVFLNVAGCGSCHALKDAHTPGGTGPNLDKVRPRPTFALLVRRVSLGFVGKFDTMPAFTHLPGAQFAPFVLTNQQIADVAAYVSAVAGR